MSEYIPVELQISEDKTFQDFLSKILRDADTGISSIKPVRIDLDELEDLSEEASEFIKDRLLDWTVRSFPENQFSLRAETLAGTDLHNM